MTGSTGTVLVVDDDSDIRSLYRCWLASSHEVLTAADGMAALDRADDADAVLLDREMPRKDGVAVARELDRREIDPAVVMISGVEPGSELLDVPVEDYLRKPVSRETVLERVERARAVAASPPRHRSLLALDTRRRIVEAAVSRFRLAGDSNYQRVVDHLEQAGPALAEARASVPPAAGESAAERPVSSIRVPASRDNRF